jgi:hypothetical protein
MRGIVVGCRRSYDETVPQRPYVIAGLVVLAVVAFAYARGEGVQKADDPAGIVAPPTPQAPPPEFIDVTVDPSGRPYDRSLQKGGSIERRPLAVLHAPSRRVLFLGGESVPWMPEGESAPITLAERPQRRYRVDAVWRRERIGGKRYEDIVGVVIVERDTPVVRWRELERVGYGTDAGLGAITTPEWAARREAHPEDGDRLYERLIDMSGRYFVDDVDGHEGADTLVFSNGYGDGGFPAVAGYDAAGKRSQIVLWTIAAPWRLAFPEGEPPPQVTKREETLAACLAGRRTVELGMRCRVAR